MSKSRAVVVDCGARRTALGIFRRTGDRLRLDEFAVEVFPAAATAGDNWLEQTAAALLVLRRQMKAGGPVVLVLPAHLALTKFIKVPRVDPATREKVIRFEASQNIPHALPDVAWDSVVVGERDLDLEVMLAAAKLDAVEPLCDAAQAAEFEPRVVLPSPLATLAAFRLVPTIAPHATLVLNLGARSTTLLLADEKRFVVRTLPLAATASPSRSPATRVAT
jgi:type IV pilus assembly protein PilM